MASPIQLGPITIHRIVEQEVPFFDALEFFPSLTKEMLEENRSWLQPTYLDPATGKIVLCFQSYVVKTPQHNILVDTCIGNDKPRPMRPNWHQMKSDRFEKGLAAIGLGFGDIDFVMCTHLHIDHVGWNTRLDNGRWVPTFPKARYLFAERELAFWTAEGEGGSGELALDHGFGAADRGGQARRRGQERPHAERPGAARSHPRAHHRSLLGARRQVRPGCVPHRRHDPFAAAGTLSRPRHARRLRLQAGRGVAPARSSAASAIRRR